MKWLEDELELNALHNPGSRRGNGNEKAALSQRTALSASLGGRVEVGAMSTISGINSFPCTFLLFTPSVFVYKMPVYVFFDWMFVLWKIVSFIC